MADPTAEETPEKTEETEEAAPARGGRLWLLVAAGAVVLLLGAGGGFLFLRSAEETPATEEHAAEGTGVEGALEAEVPPHEPAPALLASAGGEQALFRLEPFLVNINDRERDRYLKLKAELELARPEYAEALGNRLSEIRDLVISLLSSKSFDEIRTIEGKNFLRDEIIVRLNALVGTGVVRKVFFTEFVVQ